MASTQRFSTNLGLPLVPETTNPELFADSLQIFNAIRALAAALDVNTGAIPQDPALWSVVTPLNTIVSQNQNRLYVQYSEAVAAGLLVTLWNDAGTLKAKKAGGPVWAGDARGFCSVGGGVAAGDFGEVMLFGLNPLVTGATPGTLYYTSNLVAGTYAALKPAIVGNTLQPVAHALASGALFMNPSLWTEVI